MAKVRKKDSVKEVVKPKRERKAKIKEDEQEKTGIITYHNRDPKIPKDVVEITEEILKDETRKAEFHKMVENGELKWIYYSMGSRYYKKIQKQ